MKSLTPRTNLLLYSLLLILTPFILLQNYLQDLVGNVSNAQLLLVGIRIPYILLIAFSLLVFVLVKTRKLLNKHIFLSWTAGLSLWFVGWLTSDYYMSKPFYDLQTNWHYIAYGLFVLVAYNSLRNKYHEPAKLILQIFLRALVISSVDEIIQIYLTSRVFDMSDIAKDIWGTMSGIIILFIGHEHPEIIKTFPKISESKFKDYLRNPLSIIILLTIFSFLFLSVSSLLTEIQYTINIIFITSILFLILFFIIHQARTKSGKRIILIAIGFSIFLLGFSFFFNAKQNIQHKSSGLVIYKGLPLPYFDIMFFENGGFRFVDKKSNFIQGDLLHFFHKTSNILLIGNNEAGTSSLGFPENLESQFMYNIHQKRVIQIIIQPSAQACQTY
ncbi:MAG: VanZ family protein, partial [Bacteroidales bacterium]|nr:VanZ family protein [Bacteroidales bacterium]